MEQGTDREFETPSFARGTVVELRGECPRETVDVLDAIWMARGMTSRTALVNQVLGEWAQKQRHELTVAARVLGINPNSPETTRSAA